LICFTVAGQNQALMEQNRLIQERLSRLENLIAHDNAIR
jgi:hypothetical protein